MRVNDDSTNVSVYFYIIQDASATSPGEPVTGLLFSDIETGGSASYVRQGAARTDLTLITLASASAAHADGGFILVDDSNMPGVYRCDFPDAAFAAGVDQVILQLVVASANNAIVTPLLVDIIGIQDANVAQWNGSAVATPTVAGVPEVDLTHMEGGTQTVTDLKDFADAGYNPSTNKVQGVVLVDTTTANTDMRGTDSALLASSAPTNFSDLSISITTGLVNITQAAADKVWSSPTRTLTAFSTTLAISVWDVLESAILTASSIGLKVKNNLDVVLSTRMAEASINTTAGAVDNVTTVAATTTNSDMRGTDSAALAANVPDVLSLANINAEVDRALATTTYAEPAQGTPGATLSLKDKIGFLYKAWRNKSDQTATLYQLYNDDAATVDHKATVSDDLTTAAKEEVVTGP